MHPPISLPLSTHRLTFAAAAAMRLPEHLGSAWRGAFGHALKRSVCIQRLRPCEGCPVAASCLYPAVFETTAGPAARKMRRYDRVPHPYALVPYGWGEIARQPGETLVVDLVLIGRSCAHVAYVVHALTRAAAEGIGPDRGRAELVTVEPVAGPWAEAPVTGVGLLTEPSAPSLPPAPAGCRVALLTPLRLKRDGRHVGPGALAAYDLLMSLVRRLSMLIEFHGQPGAEPDFRALKAACAAALARDARLVWRDLTRRSARQQMVMQTGGLVGTLELDLGAGAAALWPYLWLGQWVGAGAGTTMGLGRYRIEARP